MGKVKHGFYFALPRLVAEWVGVSRERSEMNGVEAPVGGAIVHGVVYLCAAHYLLAGLPLTLQAALLFPLALLVWLGWVVVLYLNSLLIRLLRGAGLMRQLPDDRAQSILVGLQTTACACALFASDSILAWIGVGWLLLLGMNLTAAAALAITDGPAKA